MQSAKKGFTIGILVLLVLFGYQMYTKPKNMDVEFAKIQKEYPPNVDYVWIGHYGTSTQCDAFAKTVFERLFGIKLGSYDAQCTYKFNDESEINVVLRLEGTEIQVNTLKNAFSNARRGDFVVMNGAESYHAAIVSSVESNGVVLYDCNWHYSDDKDPSRGNVVHEKLFTWEQLKKYYGSTSKDSRYGIGVYSAKNYEKKYK